MTDFLLKFINFNQNIDFEKVTAFIIGYLILLWIFVSVWVFNDARYRFGNIFIALILAIMNLVLFLPFLFIYLLVRPSHREEIEDWYDGGVNVPLVNFVGEDGVALSIELKVNSHKLAAVKDSEMKINVGFNSDDPQKVVINHGKHLDNGVIEHKSGNNLLVKTQGLLKSMFGALKRLLIPVQNKLKGNKKESHNIDYSLHTKDESSDDDNEDIRVDGADSKKKKKKKKRKNK